MENSVQALARMKLLRREQARAAGSWGRRPTPWAAPGEGGPPCTPSLLIFCSGRVRTRIQGGTARRQTLPDDEEHAT